MKPPHPSESDAALPTAPVLAVDGATVTDVASLPERSPDRRVLPFGAVRLDADGIEMGVESLERAGSTLRALYDEAVAAAALDPDDVVIVRICETAMEVDVIDFAHPNAPVRTWRRSAGRA